MNEIQENTNKALFLRLRIAAFMGLSLLGGIIHSLFYVFDPSPKALAPSEMWIMLCFYIIYILLIVIVLLTNIRLWRWVSVIIFAAVVAGAIWDSLYHIFIIHKTVIGVTSLLISGATGILALVLTIKLALNR